MRQRLRGVARDPRDRDDRQRPEASVHVRLPGTGFRAGRPQAAT